MEILQPVLEELQPSSTAEDAADTQIAEIGHIWEWMTNQITKGDKEAAYYAEKLKAEDTRGNQSGQMRNRQVQLKMYHSSQRKRSDRVAQLKKTTDRTNESQIDTGKTAIDHDAFMYISTEKLAPIDESTEVSLKVPPDEVTFFSKPT